MTVHILTIPDLSSMEAKTYFAFKNMLPDYKDVIVPTLGTIIAEN